MISRTYGMNFNYDFYNNGSFDFDNYGVSYTGDPLADFVGGFWDNYYQFSSAVYGIRTGSFGLYAQDTWKVTSKLTLNLGLRYDYYVPQWDTHNEILGLFPRAPIHRVSPRTSGHPLSGRSRHAQSRARLSRQK